MNTDERIEEVFARMPSETDNNLTENDDKIQQFITDGCGCKLNSGQSCSSYFIHNQIQRVQYAAKELSHDELDFVLLGQIAAFTSADDTASSRNVVVPRQKKYTTYLHGGHRICRKTFLFLH